METITEDVYDAFQNLEEVEDLDVVDRTSAALARMDPEGVSGNNILPPIVHVAAFRAAVRQALLDLKQGDGGEGRDLEQFNTITSLLGLPEIYELEKRYAND